jgi:hypothetical protein
MVMYNVSLTSIIDLTSIGENIVFELDFLFRLICFSPSRLRGEVLKNPKGESEQFIIVNHNKRKYKNFCFLKIKKEQNSLILLLTIIICELRCFKKIRSEKGTR